MLIFATVVFVLAVIIALIIPKFNKKSIPADAREDFPAFIASHDQYQPYANVYGPNLEKGDSAVVIRTPDDLSAVVIVKEADGGKVAGHVYVPKGCEETLCLNPGIYSAYFIAGDGWDRTKPLNDSLTGAFTSGVTSAVLFESRKFDAGEGLQVTLTHSTALGNRTVPIDEIRR